MGIVTKEVSVYQSVEADARGRGYGGVEGENGVMRPNDLILDGKKGGCNACNDGFEHVTEALPHEESSNHAILGF